MASPLFFRYPSFVNSFLTMAKRIKLLDNVNFADKPTNFFEYLKHYSQYDSSFCLTPIMGLKQFIEDYHPGDDTFMTDYKSSENVIEAWHDRIDDPMISGILEPITLKLRDMHHLICDNPNCTEPANRVITSDEYPAFHIDCQTPTEGSELAKVIADYFEAGYSSTGN